MTRLARVFKALSNPNRLSLFMQLLCRCTPGSTECLGDQQHAVVGDLARTLDVGASTVSHHLKELSNAGLIGSRRRGQNVECWIDHGALQEVKGFFEHCT